MSNHKSFTLIELLVVIAIIGVLSAIVITSMSNTVTKSKIVRLQVFSDTIRTQLSDSLVSWWSFNEGSGTDVKDMWEGNDGTLTNFDVGSAWKTGGDCVSGSCLEFDGTEDYVDCGNDDSLDITDAITIEAWVKFSNTETHRLIATRYGILYNGWSFAIQTDEKVRFVVLKDSSHYISTRSDLAYSVNDWHYVVGVYDESYVYIYVDGVSAVIPIAYTDGMTVSGNVLIGRSSRVTSYPFTGLIDEVRIYNSAATITQIQSQYLAGLDKLLSNGAISKSEYNQRIKELSKEIVIQ